MDENTLKELDLNFDVEYREKGQLYHEEIVALGSKIKVTCYNSAEYVNERITHLVKKQIPFISEIKAGFYSIIPFKDIQCFNEDQLELIINGRPYIDVDDWEINTTYQEPYNPNHRTIRYFWEALRKMEQADLSKFLHFCTGTSRVPVGGFACLESNRGQISKFTITHIPFNSRSRSSSFNESYSNSGLKKEKSFKTIDTQNLIKAHTCFNRIDLPEFSEYSKISEAIAFIVENEILGFGID